MIEKIVNIILIPVAFVVALITIGDVMSALRAEVLDEYPEYRQEALCVFNRYVEGYICQPSIWIIQNADKASPEIVQGIMNELRVAAL